jgi:hypothetical protein
MREPVPGRCPTAPVRPASAHSPSSRDHEACRFFVATAYWTQECGPGRARYAEAIACPVARVGGETVDELTRLLLHPDHEGGRHVRHIALRSGQARALDYNRRVWAGAAAAGRGVLTSRGGELMM